MIEYIHTQLSIWGKWRIRQESKGIGYPTFSPMFRDMPRGDGFGSATPAGVAIDSAEYARDTDEAVSRLRPDHRTLCFEMYVVQGTCVEVAARLCMPKKRLYETLHAVQQEVMGHLNDIAAGI